MTDETERAARALSGLRVERERREDGREVLWFSWPDGSATDDEPAPDRADDPTDV